MPSRDLEVSGQRELHRARIMGPDFTFLVRHEPLLKPPDLGKKRIVVALRLRQKNGLLGTKEACPVSTCEEPHPPRGFLQSYKPCELLSAEIETLKPDAFDFIRLPLGCLARHGAVHKLHKLHNAFAVMHKTQVLAIK